MTKLFLKFKIRSHLDTRLKVLEIVNKYALAVDETFESPGRPDPNFNIVLNVEPDNLTAVNLALKRIPEVSVTAKV